MLLGTPSTVFRLSTIPINPEGMADQQHPICVRPSCAVLSCMAQVRDPCPGTMQVEEFGRDPDGLLKPDSLDFRSNRDFEAGHRCIRWIDQTNPPLQVPAASSHSHAGRRAEQSEGIPKHRDRSNTLGIPPRSGFPRHEFAYHVVWFPHSLGQTTSARQTRLCGSLSNEDERLPRKCATTLSDRRPHRRFRVRALRWRLSVRWLEWANRRERGNCTSCQSQKRAAHI